MTDAAVNYRISHGNLVTSDEVAGELRRKFAGGSWEGLKLDPEGVKEWSNDVALVGAQMSVESMRQFVLAHDDHVALCFRESYELALKSKKLTDGTTSVLVPDQRLIQWAHAPK